MNPKQKGIKEQKAEKKPNNTDVKKSSGAKGSVKKPKKVDNDFNSLDEEGLFPWEQ